MKFGLKFREGYQKEAGGSIAEEMDNIVAFLQILWDKVLDAEGNIKVSLTDNSHGGAGTKPVYVSLTEQFTTVNDDIAAAVAAIPSSLTTSQLNLASGSLTAAQIKCLLTSPVDIIAAPGASKIIIPVAFYIQFNVGNPGFGASVPLRIQYNGATHSMMSPSTPVITGANTTVSGRASLNVNAMAYATDGDPRNKALQIGSTTNIGGCTGTGAGSADYRMLYMIISVT